MAMPAFASDDCIGYKMRPKITVNTPDWTKQVVQPLQPMDLLHGNVVATLVDNYDVVADITSTEDGFCVGLKSVDAVVGYSDFLVQIDMRNTPGTCEYDAVLQHEDEHIRAYLSVIDDAAADLHAAVYAAADSIMPIFVYDEEEISAAVDKINMELQAHPEMLLIKHKIRAEEEIKNRRVDEHDDGRRLRQCAKLQAV